MRTLAATPLFGLPRLCAGGVGGDSKFTYWCQDIGYLGSVGPKAMSRKIISTQNLLILTLAPIYHQYLQPTVCGDLWPLCRPNNDDTPAHQNLIRKPPQPIKPSMRQPRLLNL